MESPIACFTLVKCFACRCVTSCTGPEQRETRENKGEPRNLGLFYTFVLCAVHSRTLRMRLSECLRRVCTNCFNVMAKLCNKMPSIHSFSQSKYLCNIFCSCKVEQSPCSMSDFLRTISIILQSFCKTIP